VDEPAAYHAEGILYLAPNAQFDFLLNLPEAKDIGAKVNDAKRDVAKSELRSPSCEVKSVRQSKFVIRIAKTVKATGAVSEAEGDQCHAAIRRSLDVRA